MSSSSSLSAATAVDNTDPGAVAATRSRSSYKGAVTCNQLLRQGLYEPAPAFLLRLIVVAFCWPAALGNFYACSHSLQSVLYAEPGADEATPRVIRIGLDSANRTLAPLTRHHPLKLRELADAAGMSPLLEAADEFARDWWAQRTPAHGATAAQMVAAHGQALVMDRHVVSSHLLFKEPAAGLFMTYVHGVAIHNRCAMGERMRHRPASDTAYSLSTGCLAYFDRIWANMCSIATGAPAASDCSPHTAITLCVAAFQKFFEDNAHAATTGRAQPHIRNTGCKDMLFGLTAADFSAPVICAEGYNRLRSLTAATSILEATLGSIFERAHVPIAEQIATDAQCAEFMRGRPASTIPTEVERHIVEWCGILRASQVAPTMPSGSLSFKEPLSHGPIARLAHWVANQPRSALYSLITDNGDLYSIRLNMPAAARVLLGYNSLTDTEIRSTGITFADVERFRIETARAVPNNRGSRNTGASRASAASSAGGSSNHSSLSALQYGHDEEATEEGDGVSSSSSMVSAGEISRNRAIAASAFPPVIRPPPALVRIPSGGASSAFVPYSGSPLAAATAITTAMADSPTKYINILHMLPEEIRAALGKSAAILAMPPPVVFPQLVLGSAPATAPAVRTKKRSRAKPAASNKAARPSVENAVFGSPPAISAEPLIPTLPQEATVVYPPPGPQPSMIPADAPSAVGYHTLYDDSMLLDIMMTPKPVSKEERRRLRLENTALLQAAIESNANFRAARGLSAFRQLHEMVGSPFAAIAYNQSACATMAAQLQHIVPPRHAILAQTMQRKLCSLDSLRLLFTNQADQTFDPEHKKALLDAAGCIGEGDFAFPAQLPVLTPAGCENIHALLDEADGLLGMAGYNRDTLERALLGTKKWTDAVILVQFFAALSPAAHRDNINRQLLVDIWPTLALAWARLAFAWLEKWPVMVAGMPANLVTEEHVDQCCTYWYSLQAYDVHVLQQQTRTDLSAQHHHHHHNHYHQSQDAGLIANALRLTELDVRHQQQHPLITGSQFGIAAVAAAPSILAQSWSLNSTTTCPPVSWSFDGLPPLSPDHGTRNSTNTRVPAAPAASSEAATTSYGGSPTVLPPRPLHPIISLDKKKTKKVALAPMYLLPKSLPCVPTPETNALGFLNPRKTNVFDDTHFTFSAPADSSDLALIDALWSVVEAGARN